jgi:hypothetical protein
MHTLSVAFVHCAVSLVPGLHSGEHCIGVEALPRQKNPSGHSPHILSVEPVHPRISYIPAAHGLEQLRTIGPPSQKLSLSIRRVGHLEHWRLVAFVHGMVSTYPGLQGAVHLAMDLFPMQ